MAINTEELNLFFPLNEINPQGWLNDFITPQIMANKDSVSYSMLYKKSLIFTQDVEQKIKAALSGEKLYDQYSAANTEKFKNEEKFIFLNGKYADILENNVATRDLSKADEADNEKYLLFLNQIKPYQMAFIQPYIKLYYGWKDDPRNKKETFKFVEFPFSQYFQIDEILSPSNAFLEGSGIKSVSNDVQFNIGTKRNCNISISYYFGNMNVLTKKRDIEYQGSKPKYGFSFMKIMSHSSIKKEILKLEYGYRVDPSLTNQHHIPEDICNMINSREKKVFGLHKTGHNFKFNKEGGIEVSVNYISLAESYLEANTSVSIPSGEINANSRIINKVEAESAGALDLLEQFKTTKKELIKVKEQIEEAQLQKIDTSVKTDKNKSQTENLVKLRNKRIENLRDKEKEINKTLSLIRRQMVPYFKNVLVDAILNNFDLYSISFKTNRDDNSKVYTFKADFNLISPGNNKPGNDEVTGRGKEIKIGELCSNTYNLNDFFQKDSYPQNIKDKMSGILNRIFNTPREAIPTNTNFGHIIFFPFRALIRALYQMLDKEEQEIVPHILFGNLTCRVYDKIYNINSGNVLIELNAFQKWMHESFYSKGIFDFSFGQVVKKAVDELIPDALYRNKTYPQSTNRITIQDYMPNSFIRKTWNQKNLKERLEHNAKDSDMEEFSSSIYNQYFDDNNSEPLIIFSKMDIPTFRTTTANNLGFAASSNKQLRLSEKDDAKNGIPHLIIGADGGMFMSADFSQIDLPGLRTAVALQAMTDENSSYFFYKYNLTAQVFGSSIFNHGSIICIPTPPLGLSGLDYDIGITGYYKVKGARDSIDSSGKYTSTVSADFFYDGGIGEKRGRKLSPDTTIKPVKASDIKDFIGKDVYNPVDYIDLLIKTDINTLVNFGATENKQTPKTKQPKKSKEKAAPKPKDHKEKDVKKKK